MSAQGIELKPATTVVGRVLDERGAPLKAFWVSRESLETEDGRFELSQRVGMTEVTFEAPGLAPRIFQLDVKPGKNDLGDVQLGRGRAVTGMVLDAVTRAPVVGALMEAASKRAKSTSPI